MATAAVRAPATRAGNLELIQSVREQIQEGIIAARKEAAKARRITVVDPVKIKERNRHHSKKQQEKYKAEHAANPAIRMVKTAKTRAALQGVPFDLVVDDVVVPELCPILGIPLRVNDSCGPCQNSPSLDKIIPELGYVKGNVQVISHKANAMKNDASPADMLAFAHWCTTQFGLYGPR